MREIEVRDQGWSLMVREHEEEGDSKLIADIIITDEHNMGKGFFCSRDQLIKIYKTIGNILLEDRDDE